MTMQAPDRFENKHPRLTGLSYQGYGAYYVDTPKESLQSFCTANYRGFVATFRLNQDGTFQHVCNSQSYTDPDAEYPSEFHNLPFIEQLIHTKFKTKIQRIENGILTGDFSIPFKASHSSNGSSCHVSVPFYNSIVCEDWTVWSITDTRYDPKFEDRMERMGRSLKCIVESWKPKGSV